MFVKKLELVIVVCCAFAAFTSDVKGFALFDADEVSISPFCMDETTRLTTSILSYQTCSLMNARPFHACLLCSHKYADFSNLFNRFMNNNSDEMRECREEFLSSDTVSVFNHIFDPIPKLWNDAGCDQCLNSETVDDIVQFSCNNDTTEMLRLLNRFEDCHAHTSIEKLCGHCRDEFIMVDSTYNRIIARRKGLLCMDIVDMVNTTRVLWGDNECTVRSPTDRYAYIIAAFFLTFAIVFYVTAYFYYRTRGNILLGEQRLPSMVLQCAGQEDCGNHECECRNHHHGVTSSTMTSVPVSTSVRRRRSSGGFQLSRSCPRDILSTNFG